MANHWVGLEITSNTTWSFRQTQDAVQRIALEPTCKSGKKNIALGIFSKCVVTFCATEKLRWSLIPTSRLNLPNINQHIPTFGTLHPHCRHSIHLVFFANYRYLLLKTMLYDSTSWPGLSLGAWRLLNIPAFWACQWDFCFGLFGNEPWSTIWTKFHSIFLFLVMLDYRVDYSSGKGADKI